MPVELPVSLLPGAQGGWDSRSIGQLRFMPRQRRSGRHRKTENISPSLEYRSSSGITIHAEVRGRSKGRFQKGRAPGEPSSRTGRGHHSSPPAGKGIRAPRRRRRIVFTPRAAAIPPQDGYLRSVPQAGNAASGNHTLVRARIPGILAHVHAGLTQRIARLDVVPGVVGEQDILADPVIQIL